MFNLLKTCLVVTVLLATVIEALPVNNSQQLNKNATELDADGRKRCPSVAHKSLYSPDYPSKYPNNADCTYVLFGDAGKKVKITFDEFDLEPCCDFVYLYDGVETEISKIKKLSGDHKGKSFETKLSNVMIVKFTSDANFRFKGFKAKYESLS